MRVREQRKQLVRRRSTLLNAESARVINRPHIPGDKKRIKGLIKRVSELSDEDVHHLLEGGIPGLLQAATGIFRGALQKNFERIAENVPKRISLSPDQELLLGAYFTAEYSVEAAALFNPSIVSHPDQTGARRGSKRFIMSFRATGEGHVSSIEFRSGFIDEHADIYFDPISRYVATPRDAHGPCVRSSSFSTKTRRYGNTLQGYEPLAGNNWANHLRLMI